ncbi:MAG: helix-turn-helix transcriptional regulator [Planctomycetota bacterium]
MTSADQASFALVARTTELIGGLPAVAAIDWCDRAADVIAAILEPAYAIVVVGTVSPEGDLTRQEASGASVPQSTASGNAGRALAGSLRSASERLRHVGFRPTDDGLRFGICGQASALNDGRNWRSGPASAVWSGLHPTDVMLGVYPLGDTSQGRSLVIQIATLSPNPSITEARTPVLAAVLPFLGRRATMALGETGGGDHRWLTSREQQVLERLTLGHSVREIAEELGRSPHTVHDHVKSLHRKLGASSRGELVARALGHIDGAVSTIDGPVRTPAVRPGNQFDPEEPPIVSHQRTIAMTARPLSAKPLSR